MNKNSKTSCIKNTIAALTLPQINTLNRFDKNTSLLAICDTQNSKKNITLAAIQCYLNKNSSSRAIFITSSHSFLKDLQKYSNIDSSKYQAYTPLTIIRMFYALEPLPYKNYLLVVDEIEKINSTECAGYKAILECASKATKKLFLRNNSPIRNFCELAVMANIMSGKEVFDPIEQNYLKSYCKIPSNVLTYEQIQFQISLLDKFLDNRICYADKISLCGKYPLVRVKNINILVSKRLEEVLTVSKSSNFNKVYNNHKKSIHRAGEVSYLSGKIPYLLKIVRQAKTRNIIFSDLESDFMISGVLTRNRIQHAILSDMGNQAVNLFNRGEVNTLIVSGAESWRKIMLKQVDNVIILDGVWNLNFLDYIASRLFFDTADRVINMYILSYVSKSINTSPGDYTLHNLIKIGVRYDNVIAGALSRWAKISPADELFENIAPLDFLDN